MTVRVLLEPPARRTTRRAATAMRWIARLFLLIGVVALGFTGYIYVDSNLYQRYQDWSFDQQAAGKTPSILAFLRAEVVDRTGETASTPVADSQPAPAPVADESRSARPSASERAAYDPSLIGRIEIPRLHVHSIVKEGVDDSTLRRAVGHVPGTAKPGFDGNVGLAGHRDSFFRGLQGVKKNDQIFVETLDSRYEYIVDSLKIVGPDDVDVLAATSEPVLTLVTCYPFHYVGNAPRRFIVRARQVNVEARNALGSAVRSGS